MFSELPLVYSRLPLCFGVQIGLSVCRRTTPSKKLTSTFASLSMITSLSFDLATRKAQRLVDISSSLSISTGKSSGFNQFQKRSSFVATQNVSFFLIKITFPSQNRAQLYQLICLLLCVQNYVFCFFVLRCMKLFKTIILSPQWQIFILDPVLNVKSLLTLSFRTPGFSVEENQFRIKLSSQT